MPVKTISVANTEFATATGSNYNSQNNRSSFDAPLSQNTNLKITSKATDANPHRFDVGESYGLTWTDTGVAMTMSNAVVTRSDYYAGTNPYSIVVFKGVDQNGHPAYVIWTDNLDLHQWYLNNFNGRNPPLFWTGDQSAKTEAIVCFAADVRVETGPGLRAVGELRVGDLVRTVDHGLVPVRWVGRRRVAGTGEAAPVLFAPGTLGNAAPLRLSPQHRVMLSGPRIELLTGHDEVLVPAKALVGRPGISRAPCAQVDYVNFLCDAHEVVLAEDAECETLFLGPQARAAIGDDDPAADFPELGFLGRETLPAARETARPAFGVSETRRLLALLGTAPLVAGRPEAAPEWAAAS